jgi:hypothetical protein
MLNTILNQLNDDLKVKFGNGENYKIRSATVCRSRPENLEEGISYPIIGFTCTGERFNDAFSKTSYARAVVRFYGYAEADEQDPLDNIRELFHDLRYFLFNDFTYKDKVSVLNEYTIGEGTSEVPSYFICTVEIIYDLTW